MRVPILKISKTDLPFFSSLYSDVFYIALIYSISSNEGSAGKNINWDDVIKKEARGINDANVEIQLILGDTGITEKGIVDKDRFDLPKSLVDRFDGHSL